MFGFLPYQRLQAVVALTLGASFFAAMYLGSKAKLEILPFHVLQDGRAHLWDT
jgi:hypothetical protein